MNAFPPPHIVRTRIYRWVRDPIYIGFVLACAGVSIAAGSPAGLWIVTPVTALACAALVYGYERHDLRRRFDKDALQPPVLSIPPADDNAPRPTHRAAVFLWVVIPWCRHLLCRASARPPGRRVRDDAAVREWMDGAAMDRARIRQCLSLHPGDGTADPNAARSPPLRGTSPDRDCRGLDRVAHDSGGCNQPAVGVPRQRSAGSSHSSRHSNGVAAFPAFHVVWGVDRGGGVARQCAIVGTELVGLEHRMAVGGHHHGRVCDDEHAHGRRGRSRDCALSCRSAITRERGRLSAQ